MSEFPLDWVVSPLRELTEISSGEALPESLQDGPYPWMGANGSIGTAKAWNFENGYLVGRVGAAGAVTDATLKCWASDNALTVKPKVKLLDGRYLGYLLRKLKLGNLATRSAQPLVTQTQLGSRCYGVPNNTSEQSKIAQILDTLDTQIRQTEALIAKLETVKQGLLTDLLSRGIDENGQLRPPPEEAPELYKESPLGWIPKSWQVNAVRDVLEHVIDFRGRTPKKLGMEWGGGAILALSANNVKTGGIDTSREAYYGSDSLYARWMTQGNPEQGDVLLTMEAPLGSVAQIPDSKKYILSQRVVLLRFSTDVVLNGFAFWQMQSWNFQNRMIRRSTGTTATGIQRAQLVKLDFLVPSIEEQQVIHGRLQAMDARLGEERAKLKKLRNQKGGLMDDLLTGHVRVTPLLEAAKSA